MANLVSHSNHGQVKPLTFALSWEPGMNIVLLFLLGLDWFVLTFFLNEDEYDLTTKDDF